MIAARQAPIVAALGVAAVGTGLILFAGGWLLAPTTGEKLSAAMGTADRSTLAQLAQEKAEGDAGTQALIARSLLAAGKPDQALARLAPVAAGHADDPVLIALMSQALAAAGRQNERLALLHDAAARTDGEADLRRLRVVALAANDAREERFALTRLARMARLEGDGIERLAYLEELAGAGGAARTRLAAYQAAAGRAMSADAMQRLLRLSLDSADARTLGGMLEALAARGASPNRTGIIDELIARGRPRVALALAGDPAATTPPLWRRRAELLTALGDEVGARRLLAAAASRPGFAPPVDIVAVAYRLGAPDMILLAAEHGAIPRPDTTLALDLARRLADRPAMIAWLDRVAGGDWRQRDPWLAMRLAVATDDRATALRYANMVAPDQRDAARENLLTRFGDMAGLRAYLVERAHRDPVARPVLVERLLAMGARSDATELLQTLAVHPDDMATRRLLYLWGPRPSPAALTWLRRRADQADTAGDKLRWLTLYAMRDTPSRALRVLETNARGGETAALIAWLDLSAEVGDPGANQRAVRRLLDGRALSAMQLQRVTASVLPAIDQALRLTLVRRRIAGGVALPSDRMDIAWAAWNAGDLPGARRAVGDQLAVRPDDATALMLMADIEVRQRRDRGARPWLERALAAGDGDSRIRSTLLARLGRTDDALAMTRRLRAVATSDRSLIADEARLLIAAGRPAAARALFLP